MTEQPSHPVRYVWPDEVTALPIAWADVTALQGNDNGVVVTFGHANQPVFTGTEGEIADAIASLTEVSIFPLARFMVPAPVARLLAAGLIEMAQIADTRQAAARKLTEEA